MGNGQRWGRRSRSNPVNPGQAYPKRTRSLYSYPKKDSALAKIIRIDSKQGALASVDALEVKFDSATSRAEKIKIKRAITQAANRASVASNNPNLSERERQEMAEVAKVFNDTKSQMTIPSKNGLVYRTNASGKRENIDYGAMYLSNLQKERQYASERGWTGEVAKIDIELARRAKDRTAHQPDTIESIDRMMDLNMQFHSELDLERAKASETKAGFDAFMKKQNALNEEYNTLLAKRVKLQNSKLNPAPTPAELDKTMPLSDTVFAYKVKNKLTGEETVIKATSPVLAKLKARHILKDEEMKNLEVVDGGKQVTLYIYNKDAHGSLKAYGQTHPNRESAEKHLQNLKEHYGSKFNDEVKGVKMVEGIGKGLSSNQIIARHFQEQQQKEKTVWQKMAEDPAFTKIATEHTKSSRMKELNEIKAKIATTDNKEELEKLRGDAHEIWRVEHNFGASKETEKEARSVYDTINQKLDFKRDFPNATEAQRERVFKIINGGDSPHRESVKIKEAGDNIAIFTKFKDGQKVVDYIDRQGRNSDSKWLQKKTDSAQREQGNRSIQVKDMAKVYSITSIRAHASKLGIQWTEKDRKRAIIRKILNQTTNKAVKAENKDEKKYLDMAKQAEKAGVPEAAKLYKENARDEAIHAKKDEKAEQLLREKTVAEHREIRKELRASGLGDALKPENEIRDMENKRTLASQIRHGDRVTIVKPDGSKVTGRAVMRSSAGGWVLNTGGQYGRTALADESNVIKVS